MVTINLNLSGSAFYKFTDPIRKFKANDPYYYEVDNIPLKQLEENILWIKDAVQNATIEVDTGNNTSTGVSTGGTSRSAFTELQPFVSGINTNTISVRPGRFIGRINDAYELTPLQIFSRINPNLEVGEFPEWAVAAIDHYLLAPVLNRFRSSQANSALGMNGLAERSFGSFIMRDLNNTEATLSNGRTPIYELFGIFNSNPNFTYPSFLWGGSPRTLVELPGATTPAFGLEVSQFKTQSVGSTGAGFGFFHLYHADTQFIKKWRGVARTAVVDVPENLSIQIDRFYSDDFVYFDEDEVPIDDSIPGSPAALATQRVDLLFIYSKPIDSSAVHLNTSWTSETPRKIYKAELGIVKGAGLNINFAEGQNQNSLFVTPNYQEAILANYSDELNENLGFKALSVKGSFPAPDDLMNISPAIAEWLPNNHFALVGQSILPIAYIVVKKDQLNEFGDQIIEEQDVIDIRPFFRTTELTYGERAGLAAALPAPSLANPVATESYVVYENNRIKTYIETQVADLSGYIDRSVESLGGGLGAVIGRGIVRGGNYYGPEGALCRAIKYQYGLSGTTGREDTIEKFKELHNLPANYEFKNLPDWDLATWTFANLTANTTNSFPSIGYGMTDRFNFSYAGEASGNQYLYGHRGTLENNTTLDPITNNDLDFGPFSKVDTQLVAGVDTRLFNYAPGITTNSPSGQAIEWWVSKTISLDITNTPWVKEITVIPQLWNCTSQKCSLWVSYGKLRGPVPVVRPGEPPINKYFIDFTINAFQPPYDVAFSESIQVTATTGEGFGTRTVTVGRFNQTSTKYLSPFSLRQGDGTNYFDTNYRAWSHCMQWKDDGTPWVTNTIRNQGYGGVGIPGVIYPSVSFIIIGHPRNYTGVGLPFPNQVHRVPGIRDHENWTSTGLINRPELTASLTPP